MLGEDAMGSGICELDFRSLITEFKFTGIMEMLFD